MGNLYMNISVALLLTVVVVAAAVSSFSMESGANGGGSIGVIKPPCSGTIGDCLGDADDDEELLMESEVSRRILSSGGLIDYKVLSPDIATCEGVVKGSCNGKRGKTGRRTGCTYGICKDVN